MVEWSQHCTTQRRAAHPLDASSTQHTLTTHPHPHLPQFLDAIDVERTPFTERIFNVFDDKHDGELTFGELVVSMWHYCTSSELTLIYLTFDLYAKGQDVLLEDGAAQLISDIFHGSDNGPNAGGKAHAAQRIRELASGTCDKHTFARFCEKHSNLLFPVFALQKAMQRKFLGEGFWRKMQTRRDKLDEYGTLDMKVVLASVSMAEFVEGGGERGAPASPKHRSAETNSKHVEHHHHHHHHHHASSSGSSKAKVHPAAR